MKVVEIATAAGLEPGRNSGAEVLYRCPNHDDQHPSLSLNPSRNCWLCGPCGKSGNWWELAAFFAGCEPDNKAGVAAWLREHGLSSNGNGIGKRPTHWNDHPIERWFEYGGYAVAKVVYLQNDQRKKEFPVFAAGSWGLKNKGIALELYRSTELRNSVDIIVAEGEKDVDALRSIGLTATTNTGGAGKWLPEYSEAFQSHQHVVILPDNDEPGRAHALQVAASLHPKVASVKILELPGLPEKGDVSDYIAGKDPDAAGEELSRLVDGAPIWAPDTNDATSQNKEDSGFPLSVVVPAANFVAMDIPEREDIISGILYACALGMIVGPRGIGKTRLAMALSDAVTRGGPWLAWKTLQPRRCLYIDGELPAADLFGIVRDVCGPNPSPLLELLPSEFFYKAEGVSLTLNSIEHQRRLLLLLESLAAANRRPALIVIDNLSALSYGTEENSNSEQDSLLRFLIELRHLGYTVLLIHHTGKNGEQRGASRREDFLDVVIKLEAPDLRSSTGSAKFALTFSKMRRKMPTPASIECELLPAANAGLSWGWSAADHEPETWVQCLRLVQTMGPKTQDEIGLVMKLNKSTVSRHLKTSREKNLLEGLTLTPSGKRYLESVFGGEN